VVILPPFLWLLLKAEPGHWQGTAALGLYGIAVLSDFFDGRLARWTGTAGHRWGRLDVAADVAFNFASLAVASARGLVGPWVPAIVAVLGGAYLWKSAVAEALVEDRPGKAAGVLFYLLVGLATAEAATGFAGRRIVAIAGDAVFLWACSAGLLSSRADSVDCLRGEARTGRHTPSAGSTDRGNRSPA
jgi:phosphatidylglycerophosphate synthase